MPALTARRALLPALALTLLVLPGCMFAFGTKNWHPDDDDDDEMEMRWDSAWDIDDDDLSDRIDALQRRIDALELEVALRQLHPGQPTPSAH